MRDPLERRAPPHACHPLTEDRRVDQRVAPQERSGARVICCQRSQALARDERYGGLLHRGEAAVHGVDVQALEIRDVLRDVE